MTKLFKNIFSQFQEFERSISQLEEKVLKLEEKINQLIQVERNHLIRIKNHEEVSDDFVYYGRNYNDLTPEKAWKLYSNQDYSFILIDVSDKDFRPLQNIPEAIHVPWNDFPEKFFDFVTKSIPILIISEDGTNSILACEFLVSRGYYNCNNISGGHKHWKGIKLTNVRSA